MIEFGWAVWISPNLIFSPRLTNSTPSLFFEFLEASDHCLGGTWEGVCERVRYKTRTGPWPRLFIKRRPGLVIKHGLMDCVYAMIIGLLSLMRFWCFFVSKKMPNNAVMPQRWVVFIVLADCWQQSDRTISTTHLCGITALFGVFLETKKNIKMSWDLVTL